LADSSMVGCKNWKESCAIPLYAGPPLHHYGGGTAILYGGGAILYCSAALCFCMGGGAAMIGARAVTVLWGAAGCAICGVATAALYADPALGFLHARFCMLRLS